uniref:cholesterol 7-desaturase n=1 Tax=Clastoptera arizonana TaxID=38151 RepID=A0A1B6E9K0_9HEMI
MIAWGSPLLWNVISWFGLSDFWYAPSWLVSRIHHFVVNSDVSAFHVVIAAFVIWILYYYIYLPANWVKDLSDVGFDYLMEESQHKAFRKSKKELVKEVRRRRKIGELPPIYPNGWFALAESNDIGLGQVKHVSALGENFAVFRTMKGEIQVLDAYCPHLGANMGIGGIVKGDCIECPFHGWQFESQTGKCVHIPYSLKVPSHAQVKKWTSCEVNQFIFVWYHSDGVEPFWHIEPIHEINIGKWWYRGRSEFIINCHIQEIPENGADVAHLNAIHAPSLLGGSDLRYYEKCWLSFARHAWNATWTQHTVPGEEHIGTMDLQHDIKLFGKINFISMKVQARQVGPGYVNMMIDTTIGPLAIIQIVTPIEPLLQRVIHRIFCPPMLILYAHITLIGEAIMIERDIMVWNHKKYVKPLLVKEDNAILRHRRWYSQFYSQSSPRFTYSKDTLDW